MDYRVDPKGKIFTTHVSKRNLAVAIGMGNSVIYGNVHLMADNRLKDELNQGEQFIAVTDAQVCQVGTESPLYEMSTLIINKDRVDWIFPIEPTNPPEEPLPAS